MDDDPILDWMHSQIGQLQTDAEEAHFYSLNERMFVIRMVALADENHPSTLTEPQIEVVEKLAWATHNAVYGDGLRVIDDLQGIGEAIEAAGW